MDIWGHEIASNQHAQLWYVENRHWWSKIASRSAVNGGTVEKINIQSDIKIL